MLWSDIHVAYKQLEDTFLCDVIKVSHGQKCSAKRFRVYVLSSLVHALLVGWIIMGRPSCSFRG